ncbi:transglutaminase family protein [Pseudomonadota bacterium]
MSDSPNDPEYLAPAEFVDSDHPTIISFARETAGSTGTDLERVLRLFHAIRDGIRYDPYMPMSEKQSFRASDCLIARRGWCVPKAALLAACARVIGVPARCGYADVRNHLATRKLLESMGTDVFFWHSFSDLYLEGKWVKATPAFNESLCEKFGLKPLEFDGRSDSLFHEFDRAGNKHMEYIRFRGTYADVPYAEIIATFVEEYGEEDEGLDGDFEAEAGHD